MGGFSVANYLGMLQEDPENVEVYESLRQALGNGEPADDPVRLLEHARILHEQRGELRAAAWLIELEAPLISDDPDLEAALFKELGRLRHEELLDDAGAKEGYQRALALRPGDTEIQEAIEQVELAQSKWKELARRFVEEAEEASDATLKTSLLTRAASLIWQYKKRGKDKEVDQLFQTALEADPASTRTARLYAETLRARERWADLADVLLSAANHARSRDDKLNLYVQAARTLNRRLDDRARAAECYQRVLDFQPGHEEALRFLVDFYTEREDWDHLVALYEDALRSRQRLESEQGILLQIGMVHWRIRSAPGQAEPYFARLRKIDPAHPGMLSFYRSYLSRGDAADPSRLLTILGDAQRVTSDPAQKLELGVELARAAQQSEQTTERAIDAWKAVQRLDPQNAEATGALRELYRRGEKWNALVELLKLELDGLPNDPEHQQQRIDLLREMVPIYRDRLSLDVMVINTYNAILQEVPEDREALAELARTYESMGRWNDLIQVLTRQAESARDDAARVSLYLRVAQLWIERFANYNQATKPLEEVIALDPDNRGALAQLKEIYEKKRAWKPLFSVLRKEADLASDPDARLENKIALAKLAADRLHRNADAIELWTEVVAQAPGTEGALDTLEKLADREKDWKSLAYALEIRHDRSDDAQERVKVLTKLGTVYGEHLDEPTRAAGAWKRVLEIDPKNGRALRTLRESFLAAGDFEGLESLYAEASDWEGLVEVLGTAAERTSDSALKVKLSFRAAEIYENEIGEPHRAFRNYERVLSVDPQNVRAARALVPIYQRDEKWNRLIGLKEVLFQAKQESPEDQLRLAKELRALSLDKMSDEEGAFRWATEAYRLAPTDPAVVMALEEAASAADRHEKLLELYLGRAESAGAEESMRLRRRIAAIAGERLGRTAEAIEQLEHILESHPDDAEVAEVLDRLYRSENRTQDLRGLYLHRIEHASDDIDRFMYLGEIARLEEDVLEDVDAALGHYEAMLALEPENREVLAELDRLYLARGDHAKLAEVLRRRSRLAVEDKKRVEHTLRLGDLLRAELDDPDGALGAYSEVLSEVPGHEQAVAGLEALDKSQPSLSPQIGRLLEAAYESRSSHEKLARVLERRLAKTDDEDEKRSLRLRLAELAGSQLGDVEGAYEALEAAFLDAPADVELWDRLGEAAERADKLEDLAKAFDTALGSGSLGSTDVAELSARVARIYDHELGRPEDAEPFHRKVLHEDPLHEGAFHALKELYTTNERWDELQVLYRNRIAQTVDGEQKLELLLQLCFLFEELLDDPELAIRAYQDVLDLDPSHVASRRALERLYRRTERWRDLAALLRQELDRAEGQDRLELTFELGELYEKRIGEATQAVDQYEAVLVEQPTHLRSQEALERLVEDRSQRQRIAAILEPLYDQQGAYAELARILEVQLEDVSEPGAQVGLLLRIADLFENKLHDPEPAFGALSRAVVADPADARAREELARVAKLRGTERERAEVLEKALGKADETYLKSELLMEIARTWDESIGDADAAEDAYTRLISVDSDNPAAVLPASRALERIHLEKGEHRKLAQDLRRQVKLEHDQETRRQLLVRLADLLDDTLEDVDGAIAAHRERLEIDPADVDALRALERLLERKGEWQQLVGVLQQREQATLDPAEQRAIARRIGQLYEERLDDRDSAIAAFNDVVSRFGPDRETLAALARLYESTEKWDDLLEVVQMDFDLAEDPVERSQLRFRAAELMRTRTGELERAIDAYREVLDQVPDHEGTIAALEAVMESDDRYARTAAARALVPRYEGTAAFEKLLAALAVLADVDDPAERLRSLRRAAEVADMGLEDPSRAFDLASKAVRSGLGEPDLSAMIEDLERLAAAGNRWKDHVELLSAVAPEVLDGDLQTEVLLKIAQLSSTRLEDDERAREHYAKVLEQRPDHEAALDALEQLYNASRDWAGLIDVLRRKTELALDPKARVDLLLRQAELNETGTEDVPAAIDCYEQVLDEAGRTEAYDGLERLYAREERWNDLASLYERKLDAGAGRPVEARYALGEVYRKHLDDSHAALDHYREAISLDPDHEPTIAALSEMMEEAPEHRAAAAEILEPVYLRRMDWPKVTAALEARVAAEDILDEKKTLLRRLGQIHEDYLEDLEGALEVYARLFREDPVDEEVWETLTRLARNLDGQERLAEIYAGALDDISVDEPQTAKLAFITGELFDQRVQNLDEAARFYRRALAFDPTDRAAFRALESVYKRQQANEPLLDLYRDQASTATSDEERKQLLLESAQIQERRSESDAAIDLYREILEIDPQDRTAAEALDRILTENERWQDLADHLRHRIDVSLGTPEEVLLKHRLGQVLAGRLQDHVAALDVLEEVTQQAPEHGPTIEALETMVQTDEDNRLRIIQILEPVYQKSDQWKKLIAIYEAQVQLMDDPMDRVRLLGEVARLHEERGKSPALAFGAWARAFAEEPHDEAVRAEIDRLAEELSAWDEHVAAYEQAIARTDDSMVITQLLSKMARVHDERRGDPRSAIVTYERLLRHDPDDPTPLDALEALHTMVGDWRGMVDVLDRKVERAFDPQERAELLRRSGAVQEELLNDRDGAIDAYRRASEEDPDDVIALEALDRLYLAARDNGRLAQVLRRRIELEQDPASRVELGVRLGKLAEEQLGDPQEAIEAYQRVVEDEPGHAEAVVALARLYERQALWPELLDNLRLRAAMAESTDDRVKLVHRAGEVLERELDDVIEALQMYREALELDGRHEPTIRALIRTTNLEDYREQAAEILEPQLEVQERWDDLAALLEKKAEGATDPIDRRMHLRRLARVHEQGRGAPKQAFEALVRALAEDPGDIDTADELERLAEVVGAFDRLADALAGRASSALDPTVARSLWVRLARVAEERLNDDSRAIEAYTRALEQTGDDPELLEALDRLYVGSEAWNELADILDRRIGLVTDPSERNELLVRLGAVRSEHFGDARGAFAAYQEVLERDPGDPLAVQALEKLAEREDLALEVADTLESAYRQTGSTDRLPQLYDIRIRLADSEGEQVRLLTELASILEQDLGRPGDALDALRRAFELDPRDSVLLSDVERLAEQTNGWESLRGVVERVSDAGNADRALTRDLNLRAATWYRDRLADVAAAEACLVAAIEADPEAAEAHAQRVEILGFVGGRERDMVAALRAWAAVELDEQQKKERLREAARLAESALSDTKAAAECYEAILEQDPSDPRALDDLARLRESEERWEEVVSLVSRRVDVEADPQVRLALRKRVAEIQGGPLGDTGEAIRAYEAVLDEDPSDRSSIEALEGLYPREERWEDLQHLLERRLDIAETTEDKIAARVGLARLVEQRFGRRADAIDQLREILELDPHNREALDELERLLYADEQWDEVVALLERRAADAASAGHGDEELAALGRLAEVHREHRNDSARAVAILERILARDPNSEAAIRGLVALHEAAGEHAQAADALERLVRVVGDPEEAVSIAHRLADVSNDRLGDPDRTERALRLAFELDRTDKETRVRLNAHLEAQKNWAGLAEMLLVEEQEERDPKRKVAILKRVADLYEKELHDPGSAAAHLERASELVPEDRTVLLPLCDLYVAAGRGKDAIPVLEKIIESYGTRRVKEVAQYHHRLGRALEAMGDLGGALSRYDAAFKIDLTNVQILRDLGKLCLAQGDLDRAQKSFRALLLQKLDDSAGITKADVYYHLGQICAQQGDKPKAKSMLDRALAEQRGHTEAQALLDQLKS